jgi:hypothetical protein
MILAFLLDPLLPLRPPGPHASGSALSETWSGETTTQCFLPLYWLA